MYSSRETVQKFAKLLKQELIEEFVQYGPKFTPLLDEPQSEWPTSYSKRFVTLTGALKESLRVSATEHSVSMNWNVLYKNKIRYGWVTSSGSARRGRDWVSLVLKKHPVKDAVERAAVKAVRGTKGLRLVR
jgi:hypothetical protein